MIPPSLLYKLVLNNIVVAEGSRKAMHRLAKAKPGSFVGFGSPLSTLGQPWRHAIILP